MQSVVNGFRNVCMAAVVAAFAGCSGGDAVNSLERMGLRGNVRSLDVSAYEANGNERFAGRRYAVVLFVPFR